MAGPGAKLEFVASAEEYDVPKVILLPRETTLTLGRSSKVCDVVLDATPAKTISRKHAEIVFGKQRRGPDTYTLRDLGSMNGVFVNDFKVREHTLRHGDVVQFGGAADISIGTRFDGSGGHIRYRFCHEIPARPAQAPRKRRLSTEPSAKTPAAQRPKVERTSTLEAAGTLRALSNVSAAPTKPKNSSSDGAKAGRAGVGLAGGSSARRSRGDDSDDDEVVVVSGGGRETPSAVMEVLRDAMCGLCSEVLLDAGVLPCSHSFCRLCWADHVEKKGTTCPICLRKMHSSERNPRQCSNLDLLITSIVHKLASPEERKKWRVRQEHAEKRKTAAAAAAAAAANTTRQVGVSGASGSSSGPIAAGWRVGGAAATATTVAAAAAAAAAASSVRPAVSNPASGGAKLAQNNGDRSSRGRHSGGTTTKKVTGRRNSGGGLPRRSGDINGGAGGARGKDRGGAVAAAAQELENEEEQAAVKCEGCDEEGHVFGQCPHRSDSALEGSESDNDDESEEEEEDDDEDYDGSEDA